MLNFKKQYYGIEEIMNLSWNFPEVIRMKGKGRPNRTALSQAWRATSPEQSRSALERDYPEKRN